MSVPPSPDIFALFERAVALPPGPRERFLATLDAPAETQHRLRAMLAADTRSTGFDATRAGAELLADLADDDHPPDLPTLRGHYRLIRPIGEGGSGTVYEAEQTAPRRRVAIKALKPGLTTRRAVRRLAAEADILARLQHPGIAQVHEAGLDDPDHPAQAFIVMELVAGTPITTHARAAQLTIRQRLEMLIRVCEAVEHAHQRGVIHRDLKPANILVDDQSNPKVLDFGVARLTGPDDLAGPHDAGDPPDAASGPIVGTVAYMSPEQAAGVRVDSRADVYAVGAILHELLTGQPPVPVAHLPLHEALHAVRTQSPAPIHHHDRRLRGDLSHIVSRALARDPARRFPTVSALADDLRRYLERRPIASRPHTPMYLAARHARRHLVLTTLAVVLLLTLALSAAHASREAVRYRALARAEAGARVVEAQARLEADLQRARADEANLRLQRELRTATLERGRLEARARNGLAAEAILWPAFIAHPDDPAAHGALWELFEAAPSLWHVRLDAALYSAAAHADSSRIAVGAYDGRVILLDARTGEVINTIEPPSRSLVRSLWFDDDGALWTARQDGQIQAWPAHSAAPVQTLAAEPELLAALPLPDHHAVLTGHESGRCTLLDLRSGAVVHAWTAAPRTLRALARSPDGRLLATAGADRLVRLWSPDDPSEPVATLTAHERDVVALAFTDDRTLVTAALDQTVLLWTLDRLDAPPQRIGTLRADPRAVLPLPGGAVAVATTADLTLLSTDKGEQRTVGYAIDSLLGSAAVGDAVLTAENTGQIRLWSTMATPSRRTVAAHDRWVFGLTVYPDGTRLASTSGDETIRIATVDASEVLASSTMPPRVRARALALAPDSTRLAVGCSDGMLRVLDATSAATLAEIPLGRLEIYALAFSPDGARLALAATDRAIHVLDARTLEPVGRITGFDSIPRGLAFADARTLYASGLSRAVARCDLDTLTITDTLPTAAEPWSVALSPDGHRLAAGLFDASVVVTDLRTGAQTIGDTRHRLVVAGLAFTPDGSRIVSGGDDGTVRVWDADTMCTIIRLEAAHGPIPVVRVTPDGSRIIAGTSTGHILSWDLRAHDPAIARHLPSALANHAKNLADEELSLVRAWASRVLQRDATTR